MIKKLFFFCLVLVFTTHLFSDISFARDKRSEAAKKFNRIDSNRDGVISKKEWREGRRDVKRYRESAKDWEKQQADTDKDGKVSAEEMAVWKQQTKEKIDADGDGIISPKERRMSWQHEKSKVTTKLEAEYDADKDGWLEPDEVKNYLKAREVLVKSQGKARVDSKIEQVYDLDKDGLINIQEANIMKEDTQ